ncbi:protein sax-3-like [Oscarella lobularis]|uniref:protein sax-3-like n=1 Tax=Oscarella lobularis TaxID=121494 RepID=UPI00331312A4
MCKMAFAHLYVSFLLLVSAVLSAQGITVSAYAAGLPAYHAQVGDAIALTCVVSDGANVAAYRWLKNGAAVLPTSRTKGVGTSSLHIVRLNTADSGLYGCQATLSTGEVKESQKKANLTVFGPPEIAFHPDVFYRESLAARLTCRGKNYNRIAWFRNGQLLNGPRYITTGGIGETLTIQNVILSDAGSYTCVAKSTSGGRTEKSLTLTVETDPKIVLHPANVTVQVGFRATLTCNISGIPTPSKTWFQGRTQKTVDTKNIRYVIRNNRASSTLVIENIKKTDEDYYYCAGLNNHGHVESSKAKVIVGSPPTPPPSGSEPIKIVASKTIAYGRNDSITCRAQGLVRPIVSWTKDGQPVSDPSLSQDETGELFVVNVTYDHAGQYVCTIEVDDRPILIQIVHVDVKGPPDPPVITTAKVLDGVITVNWTDSLFDGNSPITGYEAYWRQAARRDPWWSVTVDRRSTVIDVRSSLVATGIYTFDFAVKASNGYGSSRHSDIQEFMFFYEMNSSISLDTTKEAQQRETTYEILEIGFSLLGAFVLLLAVAVIAKRCYNGQKEVRKAAKPSENQKEPVQITSKEEKSLAKEEPQRNSFSQYVHEERSKMESVTSRFNEPLLELNETLV